MLQEGNIDDLICQNYNCFQSFYIDSRSSMGSKLPGRLKSWSEPESMVLVVALLGMTDPPMILVVILLLNG